MIYVSGLKSKDSLSEEVQKHLFFAPACVLKMMVQTYGLWSQAVFIMAA